MDIYSVVHIFSFKFQTSNIELLARIFFLLLFETGFYSVALDGLELTIETRPQLTDTHLPLSYCAVIKMCTTMPSRELSMFIIPPL